MRLAAPILACALGLAGCAHAPVAAPTGDLLDVTLPAPDGHEVSLTRYRGRVVLVNFFATWCMPCLAEIPYLNRLAKRFPKAQIVGIAMDQHATRVLPMFQAKFHLAYPVLLADDEVFEGRSPFGRIPAIPASFLLDRQGKVVLSVAGALDPKTFTPLLEKVLAGQVHGVASPAGRQKAVGPGGIGPGR